MAEVKRTLGGDRVGSENKMEVELHGFNRSSHDIGMYFTTDQAAGTVVPCFMDIATDGTDYYFNLGTVVRTLPTVGPLFGAFKHQIDIYKIPIRLYNKLLHNNALGIGLKMSKVKLPMMQIFTGINDNKQIKKIAQDSLTAYTGIRGIGHPTEEGGTTRKFNALGLLAYWDIYKNYYANKQEEIGMVITPNEVKNMEIETIMLYRWWTTEIGTGLTTVDLIKNGEMWYVPDEEKNLTTTQTISSIKIQIDKTQGTFDEALKFVNNQFIAKPRQESINGTATNEDFEFIKIEEYVQRYGLTIFNTTEEEGPIYEITIAWGLKSINALMHGGISYIKTNKENTNGQINIEKFDLKNIDEMREAILSADKEIPFNVNDYEDMLPYKSTIGLYQNVSACTFPQSGLGLKTYLSDRFNNWLSTEWLDGEGGINEITSVKVEDGVISMDALILQKKIYNMMNRIAVSGGSYNDWREAVYGQKTVQLPESPVYEGGMAGEILFDEVVSSSESVSQDGANMPLGTLAGRGSADGRTKGGENIHVHVEEPSIIMILESITPRVTYSQGNKWFTQLETLDDLHKPNLDGIGFQELITDEMAAFDTALYPDGDVKKFSAGKQPSWIQYQTNVDQSFGSFSAGEELDFMVLNREYEQGEDGHIKDLTTYIDPRLYNKAFADADLTAKNFWVQIKIDCTVRRVMSANQIPNL